jgi:hypothetical protein
MGGRPASILFGVLAVLLASAGDEARAGGPSSGVCTGTPTECSCATIAVETDVAKLARIADDGSNICAAVAAELLVKLIAPNADPTPVSSIDLQE